MIPITIAIATGAMAVHQVKKFVKWWRGGIAERRKEIEQGKNKRKWL